MDDPSTVSSEDPRAKILLSGSDDWVSLAEARYLVRASLPASTTSTEVRRRTLAAVHDLLVEGLLDAGNLTPGFTGWSARPEDSSRPIATEWADPDAELGPGDVCWLATTEAGDRVADLLHHRAVEPTPPHHGT